MQELMILIAEDDGDSIVSWEQDIREFNRRPGQTMCFSPVFAKSKLAAMNHLKRTRINCASIDLRLPEDERSTGGQSTEPIGNDILEDILQETGVPAVVYSGYPQEASETVKNSRMLVLGKKGGGAMLALEWLAQHEGLMSAMELAGKRISRVSAQLFNQSIWPRWEDEWKQMPERDVLTNVITRQIASHVSEHLSLCPDNAHHPEEFYVIPPLAADRLSTGDMIMIADALFVVLTPRCNLAHDPYPDNLTCVHCSTMESIWTGLRQRFQNAELKKQESAVKEMRLYATQGHATGTHFLPPCGKGGPWLADFKDVVTMPTAKVPELMKARFASIAPQFLPNLVQRYSAYLGRIGQPDLDCNVLRAKCAPTPSPVPVPTTQNAQGPATPSPTPPGMLD